MKKKKCMMNTYPVICPVINNESRSEWSCWIHTCAGVLNLERKKWTQKQPCWIQTTKLIEIKLQKLTYGGQMSSGDWKSNCQWCWSFEVITAFITDTVNNKHQDECNQCFDDNTLNRFHISSQSSNTQFSSQNNFWRCKLKDYNFDIIMNCSFSKKKNP